MICIYKIVSPSGKVYIGQTWDFDNRMCKYKGANCKGQRFIHSSILKYGFNSHKVFILKEFPENTCQSELDENEISFLQKEIDSGVIIMNIRGAGKGGRISEESKLKMSKARIGIKLSEITKAKLSLASTGNKNMLGKKHSEETKEQIRKKKIGRIMTEAEKMKLRVKKSEKGRINIAEGCKDKKIYTFINHNSNQVYKGTRFDFYSTFPMTRSSVTRLVNGEYKQTKGWSLAA